jgi:hypothetical protein
MVDVVFVEVEEKKETSRSRQLFGDGGVLMRQTVALAAANRRCQAVGATFRRGSSHLASQVTFCTRDAFFHHPHSTSLIRSQRTGASTGRREDCI